MKILFYVYKKNFYLFPFLVALLFGIHPINVNVVSYIFSRSVGLTTFFYLFSLLFFIKTFEKRKFLYIFSLLCFILAIFSRQDAVTLPTLILIFDYIFLSNFKLREVKRRKYYHIGFWLILFGYLLFRYFYFGGIGDIEAKAGVGSIFLWDRYSYFIIQPYVIIRYLQFLIIPFGLSIYHPIVLPNSIFELRIIGSFLIIIGFFITVVHRIYKRKDAEVKIISFATLLFFITLFPTSSFFPTTSPIVENRLYLSSIGLYLIVVFVFQQIYNNLKLRKNYIKNIIIAFFGIYLISLGIVTWKKNKLYKNPILLWKKISFMYPHSIKAHEKLGILYQQQHEYKKAFHEYQKAIELEPNNDEAHNALGTLYSIQKNYNKAYTKYQKALQINPNYIEAHINHGKLYSQQQKYRKALQAFQKALKLNPKDPEIYTNLSVLYLKQKKIKMAIQKLKKALQINPDYIQARRSLATIYFYTHKYNKALQEFKIILKLNPNNKSIRNKIKVTKRKIHQE
jgi:tetratricopeptide (TPR) repeat protein